jgi:hypothetical protein
LGNPGALTNPRNNRIGWKNLPVTKTPAYYFEARFNKKKTLVERVSVSIKLSESQVLLSLEYEIKM